MRTVLIVVSILIVAGLVQAQSVPDFVNYQGRLTDESGAPLATGDYALRFEVYDDPIAGSRVWGPLCFDLETGATPSDGHKFKVPVVQGYFNVVLDQDNGCTDCTDTTPDGDGLAAPVSSAFTAALRYVEVAVWNETGLVWEPILPRQHVLSSPYAVSADRSREVVSAEGQPTRIACKTGPATEVDVITVSETGVGVEGDLGVTGAVGFTGPLGVVGNVDVTGDAQISGDLEVGGAIQALTKPIKFAYFFPNGNAILDTGFRFDDYNVAVLGWTRGFMTSTRQAPTNRSSSSRSRRSTPARGGFACTWRGTRVTGPTRPSM